MGLRILKSSNLALISAWAALVLANSAIAVFSCACACANCLFKPVILAVLISGFKLLVFA
jgi:hypothetical protein